MYIVEKTHQNRRDFKAIYKCEHCGHSKTAGRYDDSYFHKEVIPNMECEKCGKKAGKDYKPMATVYPSGYTVARGISNLNFGKDNTNEKKINQDTI